MRTRPHVSGSFRKQRSFLSFSLQPTHKLPSVWHQKRKFTKTFPEWKFLKTPPSRLRVDGQIQRFSNLVPRVFSFSIWRLREDLQIHVIHHILTTSIKQYLEGMLSYFVPLFQHATCRRVLFWKRRNYFQKYPITCGNVKVRLTNNLKWQAGQSRSKKP